MYRRILVPVDGSTASTHALIEAARMAGLSGATVRLLHVVDELSFASGFETATTYTDAVLPLARRDGERILAEASARLGAAGVPVESRLVERLSTRVSDVVIDEADAWQADLIVLGTHGRRGVGRFLLGSDAEQVLRMARTPVLLVRAPSAEGSAAMATAAEAAARIATVAAC